MKTDSEKQAQQLELAAQLLRTGHPWEYKNHQDKWVPQSVTSLEECTLSGREIRPVLVTPDDGRKLNNPDNLTAEQVGVGYKLTLEEQMDGKCHSEGEWWNGQSWVKPVNYTGWFWPKNDTIRIPLSTPWPEAKPAWTMPEPKYGPLEQSDILLGDAVKRHDNLSWALIVVCTDNGVEIAESNGSFFRTFTHLFTDGWTIKHVGQTEWQPCRKEVQP